MIIRLLVPIFLIFWAHGSSSQQCGAPTTPPAPVCGASSGDPEIEPFAIAPAAASPVCPDDGGYDSLKFTPSCDTEFCDSRVYYRINKCHPNCYAGSDYYYRRNVQDCWCEFGNFRCPLYANAPELDAPLRAMFPNKAVTGNTTTQEILQISIDINYPVEPARPYCYDGQFAPRGCFCFGTRLICEWQVNFCQFVYTDIRYSRGECGCYCVQGNYVCFICNPFCLWNSWQRPRICGCWCRWGRRYCWWCNPWIHVDPYYLKIQQASLEIAGTDLSTGVLIQVTSLGYSSNDLAIYNSRCHPSLLTRRIFGGCYCWFNRPICEAWRCRLWYWQRRRPCGCWCSFGVWWCSRCDPRCYGSYYGYVPYCGCGCQNGRWICRYCPFWIKSIALKAIDVSLASTNNLVAAPSLPALIQTSLDCKDVGDNTKVDDPQNLGRSCVCVNGQEECTVINDDNPVEGTDPKQFPPADDKVFTVD